MWYWVRIKYVVNPYSEQPETVVYWRRNGVIVERAHLAGPRVLRAVVRAHNITRNELDALYECVAQSADVSEPLSASVVVKMYRKYFKFYLEY